LAVDAAGLFVELKRRRVFRALVGYGIAAFAVLQIIEPIMHGLHWPDAVLSYVVAALAAGFPVIVGLAWIFDVNAGRIERTGASASPTGLRGVRLALVLVGIGAVAAAPGTVWYFFVRGIAKPAVGSAQLAERAVGSIAVLPFVDMSPGKDQDYFSEGIAEEILNALAQVEGLQVTARTSSFSFKGKNEDLRDIGQKLGVGAVLEGSVRKAGNRVRITAQLIKVFDGFHLWSQTYDRDLTDIFAVQDEIAKAVVAALRVKLLPAGPRPQSTKNTDAYVQYLLGRQFYARGSADGFRRAADAFEKALALDPGYAPAWAGLAQASFYMAAWGGGTSLAKLRERALMAAEKAVALAPDLADAYAARGLVRSALNWDWTGGLADLERAVALNPSDAITLRSLVTSALLPVGRVPEAIAAARKATELDPLDAGSWAFLGLSLSDAGQLADAKGALRRALEISPDHEMAGFILGLTDLLDGQPAAALERFDKLSSEWMRLTGAALAQHDLGRPAESQHALDQLIARHSEDSPDQVTEVYAWRGERDRAFTWLERAWAERDTGLRYIKTDPLLRSLRRDPRYAAMLKKMNLPDER
jgi:TolB-like protein